MSNEQAFKVTKDWINANRTEKHSFTRKQIQALGVKWPPTKGWINEACDSLITVDQKSRFESAKTVFAKNAKAASVSDGSIHLNNAVSFILKNASKLNEDQKLLLKAIK